MDHLVAMDIADDDPEDENLTFLLSGARITAGTLILLQKWHLEAAT